MNEQAFMLKIKEILDNEDVTIDSVLAGIEEWDSLSIITFAAFANSTLGKRVAPTEIRACTTIRDLFSLVQGE